VVKTVALIKRLPQLERRAFREHYEQRHVPLALGLLEGLERYVRYHVEAELHGEVDFDVISAFGYRDREAVDSLLERLGGEAGSEIRADELRFMDKPANRFFPVSERLLLAGEEGGEHGFVLVGRPESMSRFECSKILVRDHWPRLEKVLDAPGFALLRDAFPFADRPAPWDALLQVRAGSLRRLEGWARSLEREGYRVCGVRTRRFETSLGGARRGGDSPGRCPSTGDL